MTRRMRVGTTGLVTTGTPSAASVGASAAPTRRASHSPIPGSSHAARPQPASRVRGSPTASRRRTSPRSPRRSWTRTWAASEKSTRTSVISTRGFNCSGAEEACTSPTPARAAPATVKTMGAVRSARSRRPEHAPQPNTTTAATTNAASSTPDPFVGPRAQSGSPRHDETSRAHRHRSEECDRSPGALTRSRRGRRSRAAPSCGDPHGQEVVAVVEVTDERRQRIATFVEPLRVRPGRDGPPGQGLRSRLPLRHRAQEEDGRELLKTGIALLAEYQRRLAAEKTHAVLLCLQSLDAGGKDGTIRHVMSGVNPQGVRVSSFKVPSDRGARPRLPVALRHASCRPGARSASSTGRTTRRSSWCASIPRPWRASGWPAAGRRRHLGRVATGRSTTGSATSSTTGSPS